MERNGKKNDGKQSIYPQRLKRLFQEQKKFSNPSARDLSVNKSIEAMFPEQANKYKKAMRSGNMAQKYAVGNFYGDKMKEIATAYERVIEKEIDIFSEDADLGSRRRRQQKEFAKSSVEARKRGIINEHKSWLKEAVSLLKKHPGWSIRSVASEIVKKLTLPSKRFQSVYKALLKKKDSLKNSV